MNKNLSFEQFCFIIDMMELRDKLRESLQEDFRKTLQEDMDKMDIKLEKLEEDIKQLKMKILALPQ